jgi:alpha-mannosidase
MDDNFAVFEKYPNYVFNWSGASRYQMMREYYPEKYEEHKKMGGSRSLGSKWQFVGGK